MHQDQQQRQPSNGRLHNAAPLHKVHPFRCRTRPTTTNSGRTIDLQGQLSCVAARSHMLHGCLNSPKSRYITTKSPSLGVLITNTQPNETQTITIQGNIGKMSSVIMAEAVAMALAARITRALNLQ